jgi:hypothetical protein
MPFTFFILSDPLRDYGDYLTALEYEYNGLRTSWDGSDVKYSSAKAENAREKG